MTENTQQNIIPPEMNRRMREALYNGEDVPTEEALLVEDTAKKDKEAKLETIKKLSASLIVKRDIAVTARASCGIEQIWREDELAFEGMDAASLRTRMIDYATEVAPAKTSNKGPKRSTVIINITRPKCETAEGRFSDIQLPTDGKNWGLLPTPVPELADSLKDERPAALKETGEPVLGPDGQPQKIKDIAKSDKEIAEDKMSKMEAEINDQLNECSFNGECRKVIQSAVRLGTGILKGPMVVKNIKKSWKKVQDKETSTVVRVLKIEESPTPASRHVDPWDCYPDPECREDIKRAGYIWERRTITPRELRQLSEVEGYLTDQIQAVLQEDPQKISVATPKDNQFLIKYDTAAKGASYEMWEYNGDVNREDLEALGVDTSSGQFPSLSACVVMVNDKPIKATLNPLDTGDLPYDFFVWTARVGVPWGLGVARDLMWPQRVLIAAWRAMMDNSGDSSGANIVVGASVEPMDGKWEITGKKLWKSTDENLRIDQQFAQFQIENNQAELQSIIGLALKFADMESQLPMLFNGEKGELPETLGATNIMVDSANVALRTRVKLWDDNITRPHITRYYDWNMQYNEDDSIKGDYKVDARGTSVLLERDQQRQSAKEVLPLRQDAEIRDMIDWKKTIKKLNLDMLPDDKIAENEEARKQQPPILTDQMANALGRMFALVGPNTKSQILARFNLKADPAELQQPVGEGAATAPAATAELQFKAQQADLDRQLKITVKQIDKEIAGMKLSQSSQDALNKIKAELTATAQKLNLQRDLATSKAAKAAPEVVMPAAEPPQRAPAGQAFQQ